MLCQQIHCKNNATWRVIDHYKQQKQSFVYFYYLCDEHTQESRCRQHTVGHRLQYKLIKNIGPQEIIVFDAPPPAEEQDQYEFDPVSEDWIKV